MNYEFKWGLLLQQPYFTWIIDGIFTTFHLAILAWIAALVLGVLIGVCRISTSRPLRLVGGIYVEVFRNVPLLVQLFIWLFVFPSLLPDGIRIWWIRQDSINYWTALLGIAFYTSARVAEQIRSAMMVIPRGQFNAALSTGLTPFQMYRFVIIPYAVRIIIPALTSEFLTVFKNTSLALTIGVIEITATTQKIAAWSFRGIEAYTVASATYALTTVFTIVLMNWVEKRVHIPGLIRQERGAR